MTLQLGNYFLPLLLIPYLVRVLGIECFGSWMFALSFVIISRTCVTYGFDLTATRQVAVSRSRPDILSDLYQAVLGVRVIIWLACTAAFLVSFPWVDELREIKSLVLLGMLILLGEILFPVWLFQGAETMGTITQVKLVSKVANLAAVMLLVRGPEDVLLVPVVEAATSFAAGAFAMTLALRRFHLRMGLPSVKRVSSEFRAGWAVFLSQASVHAYTTIHLIVLGFLAGPIAVGQYSVAEKIYSAVRGLLSPVVQALFPSLAIQHDRSPVDFQQRVRIITFRIAGVLGLPPWGWSFSLHGSSS
jgi:PST family polysaccharide transporter